MGRTRGKAATAATLVAVAMSAGLISAQRPTLSGYDRGLSLSMLKQTREDLTKNYYDPDYHGIDVAAVFAEAEAKIKAAQTTAEVTAILAEPLLRLDDSH